MLKRRPVLTLYAYALSLVSSLKNYTILSYLRRWKGSGGWSGKMVSMDLPMSSDDLANTMQSRDSQVKKEEWYPT